jgi:hypothetical protein
MSGAVSPLTGAPLPKGGRTVGARTLLSRRLIEDFTEAWHKYGTEALKVLAIEDPGKFAALGFAILPRDVLVSVEQRAPGGLSVEDWATVVRVLDLIRSVVPPGADAPPGEVFAVLEEALRARYAKPVECKPNLEGG